MSIQPKPVTPEPSFELSPGERNTDLWKRIEQYLEGRLRRARIRNDGDLHGRLSPEDAACIRGEILCLKSILTLRDDRPPQGGR